jgi:hypothetical protein
MRPYVEEKSYTVKVLANGDRETTILHNQSNQFGNDIPMASKTIIDKDGVRSYDKGGKLLVNIPHSPLYLEHYKTMKTENNSQNNDKHGPDFKKVTDFDINTIKNQGGKVKNLSNNGGLHIRKGDEELLYDTLNKTIEKRTFEGKNLKYSHFQKFKTNSTGKIVPAYKKEVNLGNTEKGNRLWHFKEEEIIYYTITYSLNGRSAEESNLIFKVFPNPSTKEITVQLPKDLFEQAPIITIYDLLGKVTYQQKATSNIEVINMDNYTKGVYLLQVETSKGDKLNQKFIKQ